MDFDGDQRLDLFSTSNCCDTAAFHLFRRLEDGSWSPRQRLEVTPPEKLASFTQGVMVVADWNGDGAPDLLCRKIHRNRLVIACGPFRNDETIMVTDEIDVSLSTGNVDDVWLVGFAVADWDCDGRPDLLLHRGVPGSNSGIEWCKNLGGPGLTKLAEGKLLLDITRDMDVVGFCVGDWNGDAWPDLLVSRSDERSLNEEGKHVGWRGRVWLYPRE